MSYLFIKNLFQKSLYYFHKKLMSYLFLKNQFQKSLYYFQKNLKIKKNPKTPKKDIFSGFFRWFFGFFGFLGGFFGFFWVGFYCQPCNPGGAEHHAAREGCSGRAALRAHRRPVSVCAGLAGQLLPEHVDSGAARRSQAAGHRRPGRRQPAAHRRQLVSTCVVA
jgi:hypothetical protein